jgi:hypothetical protein
MFFFFFFLIFFFFFFFFIQKKKKKKGNQYSLRQVFSPKCVCHQHQKNNY